MIDNVGAFRFASPSLDSSLPVTEDGQSYDVTYRTREAIQAIEASRFEQPVGIARPPGPSGFWFMVAPMSRRRTLADMVTSIRDRYPRIAYLKVGPEHIYVLSSPDLIQDVFSTHGRDTMKGRGLQVARSVLGEGLLTAEGEQHLRNRRMIQPEFHRERIARYSEQMVEVAAQRSAQWVDGQVIEINASMSELTLAIVGRALFGSDLSGDAREVSDALHTVMHGFRRLMIPGGSKLALLPLPGNKRMVEDANRLDRLVQRMIDEHRRDGDNGDLLSMLITAQEDGHFLNDMNVRDEAMTMVLAGHETTAMTLTWTWMLLSQNPAIRQELQDELDRVLDGREPTFVDYANLHFTRACIAESMRLYPAAWMLGRRLLTDMTADEWQLPKGSVVLASQFVLHRDPRFWELPDAFLPSRWLDNGVFSEWYPGQPKGAWFPFGFGKRRCIGDQFALVEAALVLATLAQQWELELINPTPPKLQPVITLRPGEEMPMRLRSLR